MITRFVNGSCWAFRFGVPQKGDKAAATGVAQDPEALKKRAERFGLPVKSAASATVQFLS